MSELADHWHVESVPERGYASLACAGRREDYVSVELGEFSFVFRRRFCVNFFAAVRSEVFSDIKERFLDDLSKLLHINNRQASMRRVYTLFSWMYENDELRLPDGLSVRFGNVDMEALDPWLGTDWSSNLYVLHGPEHCFDPKNCAHRKLRRVSSLQLTVHPGHKQLVFFCRFEFLGLETHDS